MKLKNVYSNGGNVVASILNNVNLLILENCEIELKNKHHMSFFLRDVMIAQKTFIFFVCTCSCPFN
jgi:hypothetical protein